jgi:hypothetical protein
MFEIANHIEAAFWALIGLAFAVRGALVRDAQRASCFWTAGVFLAFGLSDVVEAWSGAWWRPWWLLVWKGGCLGVMVVLFVGYQRRRRRGDKR